MKITHVQIIDFIELIFSDEKQKRLFTNVWIDLDSIFKLFIYNQNLSHVISKGSFMRKLNFVTDSNQYCIHRKRTWNCTSKVFNWWYLMTRSDCQVGMLSRRCKTHICDINTAFLERDVNASEEGDMEQYYRILENEQNQINSTNVDIENVGAGNRNTNNNASTTIANCNSPTQSFVEDIPTETITNMNPEMLYSR